MVVFWKNNNTISDKIKEVYIVQNLLKWLRWKTVRMEINPMLHSRSGLPDSKQSFGNGCSCWQHVGVGVLTLIQSFNSWSTVLYPTLAFQLRANGGFWVVRPMLAHHMSVDWCRCIFLNIKLIPIMQKLYYLLFDVISVILFYNNNFLTFFF